MLLEAGSKYTDDQYIAAFKAVGTPSDIMQIVETAKNNMTMPDPPDQKTARTMLLYSTYAFLYLHDPNSYKGIKKLVDDGQEIYAYQEGDDMFIYRPMFRMEFSEAIKIAEPMNPEFEEYVVSKCVVFPKYDTIAIKTAKSGTVSTLAKLIMMVSGFNDQSVPISLKI